MPKEIQQEILFVHKGHEHFIKGWTHASTKTRLEVISLDKKFRYLMPKNHNQYLRIGNTNDGGYIIPKILFEKADALLSGGISKEWTFEKEWCQLKPYDVVHAYDATYSDAELEKDCGQDYIDTWKNNNNTHFFFEFLGPDHVSFKQALDRLPGKNIFVKLDIEGNEYLCIDDILLCKDRIIGIAIEFHKIEDLDVFEQSIQKLLTHYDVTHIHGNNLLNFPYDGQLPYVLEITLSRKEFVKNADFRNPAYLFGLDQPNNYAKNDWLLYFE